MNIRVIDVGHNIQPAIAPVFLLSLGTMLLVLTAARAGQAGRQEGRKAARRWGGGAVGR